MFSFNDLPKAVTMLQEKLETIEQLLKNNRTESSSESDELLTIKEASKLLNLSVPTLYGYVHKKEIPFSKSKKRLYFSKSDLTNWIKSGISKEDHSEYLKIKKG